jgi:hypothetical protein
MKSEPSLQLTSMSVCWSPRGDGIDNRYLVRTDVSEYDVVACAWFGIEADEYHVVAVPNARR